MGWDDSLLLLSDIRQRYSHKNAPLALDIPNCLTPVTRRHDFLTENFNREKGHLTRL